MIFLFLIFHEHVHNGYKNLRILVWILVECTLVCKVHIGAQLTSYMTSSGLFSVIFILWLDT